MHEKGKNIYKKKTFAVEKFIIRARCEDYLPFYDEQMDVAETNEKNM